MVKEDRYIQTVTAMKGSGIEASGKEWESAYSLMEPHVKDSSKGASFMAMGN